MRRHVIIGGAEKSGTTSLFNYLGDHPSVLPSPFKESRFFGNKDSEFYRRRGFKPSLDSYMKLFHDDEGRVLLEATANYLYLPDAPAQIKTLLENPLVIFILRNPLERFLSSHRYLLQRGGIPQGTTVNEFIGMQDLEWKTSMIGRSSFELYKSFYSQRIEAFQSCLGRENVLVFFAEHFYADTCATMRDVCDAIGIDGSYYNDYVFQRYNQSRVSRFPRFGMLLTRCRQRIKDRLYRFPGVVEMAQLVYSKVKPTLIMLDTRAMLFPACPDETRERLLTIMFDDVARLKIVLGCETTPWADFENLLSKSE